MPPVDQGPPPADVRHRVSSTVRRTLRRTEDRVRLAADPSFRRLSRHVRFPDGSRRIYLHHVRKTAGTALFQSLLALGGEDPVAVWRRMNTDRLRRTVSGGYAFASGHPAVLAEGAYFAGRAHRPVDRLSLPPETFTVVVLRDPVARVRSYFDYLLVGDPPDAPGRVSDQERAVARDGFDRFLDRVSDRHLLTQLVTFSPSADVGEAAAGIAACSAVLTTERLADGVAALNERLGLELTVRTARVTGQRTELTDAQLERLRSRLAPEYDLLDRLAAFGLVPPPGA